MTIETTWAMMCMLTSSYGAQNGSERERNRERERGRWDERGKRGDDSTLRLELQPGCGCILVRGWEAYVEGRGRSGGEEGVGVVVEWHREHQADEMRGFRFKSCKAAAPWLITVLSHVKKLSGAGMSVPSSSRSSLQIHRLCLSLPRDPWAFRKVHPKLHACMLHVDRKPACEGYTQNGTPYSDQVTAPKRSRWDGWRTLEANLASGGHSYQTGISSGKQACQLCCYCRTALKAGDCTPQLPVAPTTAHGYKPVKQFHNHDAGDSPGFLPSRSWRQGKAFLCCCSSRYW